MGSDPCQVKYGVLLTYTKMCKNRPLPWEFEPWSSWVQLGMHSISVEVVLEEVTDGREVRAGISVT